MQLTSREKQVLALAMTGLSDKSIAKWIGVSPRTVNSHLQRIYIKIGAKNRTEAIFRSHDECCKVEIPILIKV